MGCENGPVAHQRNRSITTVTKTPARLLYLVAIGSIMARLMQVIVGSCGKHCHIKARSSCSDSYTRGVSICLTCFIRLITSHEKFPLYETCRAVSRPHRYNHLSTDAQTAAGPPRKLRIESHLHTGVIVQNHHLEARGHPMY